MDKQEFYMGLRGFGHPRFLPRSRLAGAYLYSEEVTEGPDSQDPVIFMWKSHQHIPVAFSLSISTNPM